MSALPTDVFLSWKNLWVKWMPTDVTEKGITALK